MRETQNYAPSFTTLSYKQRKHSAESYRILNWSTYSDLPYDWKLNRGKLALINHPWKCKKGKNRRSPLVHSRKLAEHDNFTRAVPRRNRDRGQEIGKILPAPGTNQIAEFSGYRPLTIKEINKWWLLKLKTEGQTIYRKPQRKVTKLKSKFYFFVG